MIKKIIEKLIAKLALLTEKPNTTKDTWLITSAREHLLRAENKQSSLITPSQEYLLRTTFK